MLVTNGGQLIRCPVSDIRIAGRSTQGVTIFNTAADEQVVSVSHIPEESGGENADPGEEEAEPGSAPPQEGDGSGPTAE